MKHTSDTAQTLSYNPVVHDMHFCWHVVRVEGI